MARQRQHATIVTDLGFGDAGKGSIVDYLAREQSATCVIRFNGGPQAGHTVVLDDGRQHTFHQFGSASFVPGVRTHLSRFMLINPYLLWTEALDLVELGVDDVPNRITIDEGALVITPYHEASNRLRELMRGNGRHGSCGLGVGETMGDSLAFEHDALFASDLLLPHVAFRKLESTRLRKLHEFDQVLGNALPMEAEPYIRVLKDQELSQIIVDFYKTFTDTFLVVADGYHIELLKHGHVIFEGAQGVLLDEWYGFHPYTTWSTTTNANANTLLAEARYAGDVTRLGLLRSYATRHGAGPFPTEDSSLTDRLVDRNNPTNPWQQSFRVGWFDAVLARYALDIVGPIDGLVISCLDQLEALEHWFVGDSYVTDKGQIVTRLPRVAEPDLEFQSELTKQVCTYVPHYTEFIREYADRRDVDRFIRLIETELGTPVVLRSFGPTASDKVPSH